jgi:hypothetical protein
LSTRGRPAATCEKLLDDSLHLMDDHPAEADAAYAAGYARCGAGYGFLEARTFISFRQQRWDEGGEYLLKAISEPHPTLLTMKLIAGGMATFSDPMKARFLNLGHTAAAPVYVPDVGMEYAWITLVSCGVSTQVDANQSLVAGAHGPLDLLTFTCPGAAAPTSVYFDYSADPMEQTFVKELGATPAAPAAPAAPPPR